MRRSFYLDRVPEEFHWSDVDDVPEEELHQPGVYIVTGWHERELYLGKSVDLGKRIESHKSDPWYKAYSDARPYTRWYVCFLPAAQITEVERRLIATLQPKYNVTYIYSDTKYVDPTMKARVRASEALDRAKEKLTEAMSHYTMARQMYHELALDEPLTSAATRENPFPDSTAYHNWIGEGVRLLAAAEEKRKS